MLINVKIPNAYHRSQIEDGSHYLNLVEQITKISPDLAVPPQQDPKVTLLLLYKKL